MRKEKSRALSFLSPIDLNPRTLAVLFFLLTLIIWLVPQCQLSSKKLSSPDKQAEMENAYRATLVQALGGAFFFVTSYLTWRNLEVAEKNLKITEEKQVTERFSKAIELLGSDQLSVRLGGIYALERIAKDSPKDVWTIMEVLTSFVQEKSPLPSAETTQGEEASLVEPKPGEQSSSSYQKQELQKITTEVQAAITVIGRRYSNKHIAGQRISLTNINLTEANLNIASLSRANFRRTNLSRADLSLAYLVRANLIEANLHEANLSGADLSFAEFMRADLSGASLSAALLCRADFFRANLSGAIFAEADLTNANLNGVDLSGAFGLTREQIDVAHINENTKLPDYLPVA